MTLLAFAICAVIFGAALFAGGIGLAAATVSTFAAGFALARASVDRLPPP